MLAWLRKILQDGDAPTGPAPDIEAPAPSNSEPSPQAFILPVFTEQDYTRLHAGWRGTYADIDALVEIIVDGMYQSALPTLLLKIDVFAEDRGLSEHEMRMAVLACLDMVAEKSMEDMIVSEREEEYLTHFLAHFGLGAESLSHRARDLLNKGIVARKTGVGEREKDAFPVRSPQTNDDPL